MADTTTEAQTVSGNAPSAENSDPNRVTAAEHKDAVAAVRGEFAPVPVEDAEGVVRTTRDLPSERAKTEKLVEEVGDATAPFTESLGSEERDQKFKRTLANGKTEAVVAEQPPFPTTPPDDGGYNPEKRTHAYAGNAITPQAATAHTLSGTAGKSDVPTGWREEDRVDA